MPSTYFVNCENKNQIALKQPVFSDSSTSKSKYPNNLDTQDETIWIELEISQFTIIKRNYNVSI